MNRKINDRCSIVLLISTEQQTDSGNKLQDASDKSETALHRLGLLKNDSLPPLQPQVTQEETTSVKRIRGPLRATWWPAKSKVSQSKTESSKGQFVLTLLHVLWLLLLLHRFTTFGYIFSQKASNKVFSATLKR